MKHTISNLETTSTFDGNDYIKVETTFSVHGQEFCCNHTFNSKDSCGTIIEYVKKRVNKLINRKGKVEILKNLAPHDESVLISVDKLVFNINNPFSTTKELADFLNE